MSHKNGLPAAKLAIAMSLALSFSALHAAEATISDDSLAAGVRSALHGQHGATGTGIRVQAIDGTVYLYGTVDTYPERVDVENAANAAAQGHKVVDSIEFSPS